MNTTCINDVNLYTLSETDANIVLECIDNTCKVLLTSSHCQYPFS